MVRRRLVSVLLFAVFASGLSSIETTDLNERNIVLVREGSPVTVTFDAIPALELPGRVNRIQALGENRQGDITYTVTINLDHQDPRLRWNMTAVVAIGQ